MGKEEVKVLTWTDKELEEIRDEVFGGNTVMCECSTIEELRVELTFLDWYEDKPVKAFKSKRKALEDAFVIESAHCSRSQEDSCNSVWRHAEAGNFTDKVAEERVARIKQDYQVHLDDIKSRLMAYLVKHNL